MVDMWLLTVVHRVLARQYGCHVITYCNAQNIGQAIWLQCDYCNAEYRLGNMVAMWLFTAMHGVLARQYGCHAIIAIHRVLARQYGCHAITYCNAQSTGQAIWLPCDYLLQFTEYLPGNMVAMWLLTAVHRILTRQYGCHVIIAIPRVLARQYGCHVFTYCSAQSTGRAIWLPCDYCNAQSTGQAIWFPCDYLLQCTEYLPGNMVAMWLLTAAHRILAKRYDYHTVIVRILQALISMPTQFYRLWTPNYKNFSD
jgi:hypothetical protein